MCVYIYIYVYTERERECDRVTKMYIAGSTAWLTWIKQMSTYVEALYVYDMYICIYVYIYMYIHMCDIYIYIHIYVYTYIHIYVYIHMYIHASKHSSIASRNTEVLLASGMYSNPLLIYSERQILY